MYEGLAAVDAVVAVVVEERVGRGTAVAHGQQVLKHQTSQSLSHNGNQSTSSVLGNGNQPKSMSYTLKIYQNQLVLYNEK